MQLTAVSKDGSSLASPHPIQTVLLTGYTVNPIINSLSLNDLVALLSYFPPFLASCH